MRRTACVAAAVGMFLMQACSRSEVQDATSDGEQGSSKPVVYTVNYPLQYFAQRIGGGAVDVVFPAPADEDPAYWKPGVDDVAAFQQADLILLNGADYAKWTARVSLPGVRVVNTCSGLDDAFIPTGEETTHAHGPDGEHAHGGVAFTTWLDGDLALAQAEAVQKALAMRWPDLAETFEAGFQGLAQDLQALDASLKAAVSDDTAIQVVFSHPVYQYLARAYGIAGESVHFEPGEEPSPEMWADLEAMLQENPASIMIWEGDPMPAVAERLASLGLANVVFDPAGNVPDEGDYLDVMQANAERLAEAFAE